MNVWRRRRKIINIKPESNNWQIIQKCWFFSRPTARSPNVRRIWRFERKKNSFEKLFMLAIWVCWKFIVTTFWILLFLSDRIVYCVWCIVYTKIHRTHTHTCTLHTAVRINHVRMCFSSFLFKFQCIQKIKCKAKFGNRISTWVHNLFSFCFFYSVIFRIKWIERKEAKKNVFFSRRIDSNIECVKNFGCDFDFCIDGVW